MSMYKHFFEEENITGNGDSGCGCPEGADCCNGHGEEDMDGETTITMTDAEGNEYEFMLYDELQLDDETYLMLLTLDEDEPELVIVRVVIGEEGNDTLVSVDEDEFDNVFEEYERLCDEEEKDEEFEEG